MLLTPRASRCGIQHMNPDSKILSMLTLGNMFDHATQSSTYDHRSVKTGHPVRSAIHKH
jgi:hypothetical protein